MTKTGSQDPVHVDRTIGRRSHVMVVDPSVSAVNSIGISLDDSDPFLSILLLAPVISAQLPSNFVEGSKIRACTSLSQPLSSEQPFRIGRS